MTNPIQPLNNGIDFAELFAAIWSHKFFITLITAFSIVISGYFALTSDKEYTAKALFEIEQNKSSGLNLSGELGALASLAGLRGTGSSGNEVLLERIMGREFILTVSQSLSLEQDPFFQTYVPNLKDPVWKSLIKSIIGWKKSIQNESAIIQETIQRNYSRHVSVSTTSAGAIEISVKHSDARLAAKYANGLMEHVRQLIEDEEDKSKEFRLSYLAETLADALQDMEDAQNQLKNYALENSTAAPENFIAGSLKLDNLRMERREANEFVTVLGKLSDLVKFGNLDISAYEALREEAPLIDDVNFRRVLGMSETISAWSWPELDIILNVTETLQDRVKRLDVEIADIEENAKEFASNAENFARLTRDMKIAEATFTVLTEQVKSQSLAAGFKPDTFKVFAYASPPLTPSSPKRNLVLAMGAMLGLFIGCVLSMANAIRRGVFYTKTSIIRETHADISLKSNTFRRIAKLPTSKISTVLNRSKPAELEEAEATLAKRNIIYIVNTGSKPSAAQLARLLATQSCHSGRNVLIFDESFQSNNELEDELKKDIAGVSIVTSKTGFDVVTELRKGSFLISANFEKQMNALLAAYDQIFISSDNKKSNAGLIALKAFNPGLVVLTRLRKTTKSSINKIRSIHPINIVFHA